ncbi:hypothetical protein EP47_03800 [Legionella norrlandica]|uniref:Uncharacterized protein n=1 Tax=Legionella norrlandica TaxID=1498499 RepID=A0A0A2SSG1_9GAMM|nr:class I SAM-dependent methyltransferase [Legionella norrlandica]KGP64055.1 hypothetical protein EP47_03800 [Legionella norrlandica]
MIQQDPVLIKSEGDKALEAGDLPLALKFYDQALEINPQFSEAYYQKGTALLRMGEAIKAAAMFWQAYLFSQFKMEIGLMTAKTLAHAKNSLSACKLFETFRIEDMDRESLSYYLYALRLQGRIKEAYALFPYFKDDNSPKTNWAKAMVLLDLNKINEACALLEPLEETDNDGHITVLLHAVYIALNDKTSEKSLLDRAIKRISNNDYFCCQRIAIDILDGLNNIPIDAYRSFRRFDLIDAADYLHKNSDKNLISCGTTFQTFDLLAPHVTSTGIILEFGVRFGYSISHIAELFPERQIFGFDSFQGLPEDWHHEKAGSYSTYGKVPSVADNVTLIAGWFNETLPDFKKNHQDPIAFMNIDCDLYSSTKLIFDELSAQIIPGTIIVFDEYIGNATWRQDEFKAFQEWVKGNKVKYRYLTASFYTKQVSVQILDKKKEK